MSAPVAEQTMNNELSYAALPERAHAYSTWTTEIDFAIKRAPFVWMIYLLPMVSPVKPCVKGKDEKFSFMLKTDK